MDAAAAIEALKKALPADQLAILGTPEYDQLNGSYQSQVSRETKPAAIFRPRDSTETSLFVKTIKPFALSGQAPFAIFGAGQQPAIGSNNIQDGITLNLSLLKGIELKDGVVSVAAGERWGAVYKELDAHGLSVAGGRSANNGIGGLALQCTMNQHNDYTVVRFEVVLASGEIVYASATEHPELWRALRGGGNNFGVVTRFDFRTFEQGQLYGGSVYYFGATFPSEVDALVSELQKKSPAPTPETHLMVSIGFAAQFGPNPVSQNQVYYTRDATAPTVLDPFTKIEPQIQPLNTLRLIPNVFEAAQEQAGDQRAETRVTYMNTTLKADVDTILKASEIYQKAIAPVQTTEGLICSLTLQPFATSLLKSSSDKGGNSLGLNSEHGPLISVLLLSYWQNKTDDDSVIGAMKEAVHQINEASGKQGTHVPYIYMNYALPDQDVIGSYGHEAKKSLQEASKQYDPEGLFQRGVPGGWKLFA